MNNHVIIKTRRGEVTYMIYITGDCHGDWTRFFNFYDEVVKKLTPDDYIIVCGDFGIWSNEPKRIKNLDKLEQLNFNILFVTGNHENYDLLETYPKEEWHGGEIQKIRENVYHLCRGQVFAIDGKKFFTFGGASSHDIQDGIFDADDPKLKSKMIEAQRQGKEMYRIRGLSWWAQELPTAEEMETGLRNLREKCKDNHVDYIITHCPYTSLSKNLDDGCGLYNPDILTDYLEKIKELITYDQWFFGHMHLNKNFPEEKATCLYDSKVKLDEHGLRQLATINNVFNRYHEGMEVRFMFNGEEKTGIIRVIDPIGHLYFGCSSYDIESGEDHTLYKWLSEDDIID